MAMTPLAFFTLGLKGPAADERKRQKALLDAQNQAKIDALATPTTPPADTTPAPVTPPDTTALASSNIGGAKTAAERQRKRAAAGSSLVSATPQSGGPGASLAPRTLIGA
jgi:hypothetical protein